MAYAAAKVPIPVLSSSSKFFSKKNIRLVNCNKFDLKNKKHYLFLGNAFLSQDSNSIFLNNKIKIVSRKKPSLSQLNSLKFAFNICKFVKSNAIVLVNNKSTIGIGSGQPSRLDSCKIAVNKALDFMPEKIIDSVAASDAFFPFSDGVEELINAGVKVIIQPGGSINDKKVIKTANEGGITKGGGLVNTKANEALIPIEKLSSMMADAMNPVVTAINTLNERFEKEYVPAIAQSNVDGAKKSGREMGRQFATAG